MIAEIKTSSGSGMGVAGWFALAAIGLAAGYFLWYKPKMAKEKAEKSGK